MMKESTRLMMKPVTLLPLRKLVKLFMSNALSPSWSEGGNAEGEEGLEDPKKVRICLREQSSEVSLEADNCFPCRYMVIYIPAW